MKKTKYVILQDYYGYFDEGGNYSESTDTFLGIVTSFDTARNIIEYLIDTIIGDENPEHKRYCGEEIKKQCRNQCEECVLYEKIEVEVIYDDWDEILVHIYKTDDYDSEICYHFEKIEVEV